MIENLWTPPQSPRVFSFCPCFPRFFLFLLISYSLVYPYIPLLALSIPVLIITDDAAKFYAAGAVARVDEAVKRFQGEFAEDALPDGRPFDARVVCALSTAEWDRDALMATRQALATNEFFDFEKKTNAEVCRIQTFWLYEIDREMVEYIKIIESMKQQEF